MSDDVPTTFRILRRQLFFSLVSGEIFELEDDEVKNAESYQIPLKQRPSSSCRKCYGRLYIGINSKTKMYQPCRACIRKCIDIDRAKEFSSAKIGSTGIHDPI